MKTLTAPVTQEQVIENADKNDMIKIRFKVNFFDCLEDGVEGLNELFDNACEFDNAYLMSDIGYEVVGQNCDDLTIEATCCIEEVIKEAKAEVE